MQHLKLGDFFSSAAKGQKITFDPIVEMGLFMDKNGIPISMCLHPGNTGEQLTAVPLEKEILKMTEEAKFIYCAGAGLGSYNIHKFNSMGGLLS